MRTCHLLVCFAVSILLMLLVYGCSNPTDETWALHTIDNSGIGADGVRLADFNKDGLMDIATGWEESGFTRLYINPGIERITDFWPFENVGTTPDVEDAMFFDFDENGVLEIISSCEGETKTIFVHYKDQANGDWVQLPISESQYRMQWMYSTAGSLSDGGPLKLFSGGKGENAEVGYWELPSPLKRESLDIAEFCRVARWRPISKVGWLMSMIHIDVNKDSAPDLLISDRFGELSGVRWLENPWPDENAEWENHWIGLKNREVLSISPRSDASGSLTSLFAVTRENELFHIIRNGGRDVEWSLTQIAVPDSTGDLRAPNAADINRDGSLDVVVSTWNANDKMGLFALSLASNPNLGSLRKISDSGTKFDAVVLTDLNLDGYPDILTTEEQENGNGLGVVWFENPGK